jgi:HSP20 family protein
MLNRWDPFSELSRLQDHLYRSAYVNGGEEAKGQTVRPAVDIREEEDSFVLHVELPGVKLEDVAVEVERNVLGIRGERKFSNDEKVRKSYRRVEQYYGNFQRSFSLPENVDSNAITAQMVDGILSVRLPKKAAPTPRKISVNAAS